MTLTRFWMVGDQAIWFVSLILLLYLMFPLIYLFLFDGKPRLAGFLRLLVLMGTTYLLVLLLQATNLTLYQQIEIAITRIPVFIFGVWMGKFVYEGRKLPRWCAVLPFVIAVAFFVTLFYQVLHGPQLRFFYLIGGVSLSYAVALVCCLFDKLPEKGRILYRFLAWTGGFSLELYITHITLNQIMRSFSFYQKGDLAQYAAMAVLAFFSAWVLMKVISFAKAKLTRPRESIS